VVKNIRWLIKLEKWRIREGENGRRGEGEIEEGELYRRESTNTYFSIFARN